MAVIKYCVVYLLYVTPSEMFTSQDGVLYAVHGYVSQKTINTVNGWLLKTDCASSIMLAHQPTVRNRTPKKKPSVERRNHLPIHTKSKQFAWYRRQTVMLPTLPTEIRHWSSFTTTATTSYGTRLQHEILIEHRFLMGKDIFYISEIILAAARTLNRPAKRKWTAVLQDITQALRTFKTDKQ